IAALDPPRIAALAAALEADDPPATAGRNGVLIGYEPGPARRRLVEFDRRGHLLAVCRWAPDGELASASCLTHHGAWIGIGAASPSTGGGPPAGRAGRRIPPWGPPIGCGGSTAATSRDRVARS